jgi:hypothetical protein
LVHGNGNFIDLIPIRMALEKDQHPTARLARIVSIGTMVFVTLVVFLLYGVFFDRMSETDLVQISFIWVSLVGFGIGGLIVAHKGVGFAIGIGLAVAFAFFLALEAFFITVWPSL